MTELNALDSINLNGLSLFSYILKNANIVVCYIAQTAIITSKDAE